MIKMTRDVKNNLTKKEIQILHEALDAFGAPYIEDAIWVQTLQGVAQTLFYAINPENEPVGKIGVEQAVPQEAREQISHIAGLVQNLHDKYRKQTVEEKVAAAKAVLPAEKETD